MNLAILAAIAFIVAAPMLISMVLIRVSKVLYSGPASVLAASVFPDRQGMYLMSVKIPDMAPIRFHVSPSRAERVFAGENAVMVSVARRLVDGKTVIDQILWQYETKEAAKDGRYDKIKPDRPVDIDMGIIPGLLYCALAMGSVVLFVGDNFVSSFMKSDALVMHACWYANAACVALCGYWLARKQPQIAGYLSEGGSRMLLGVLFSIIGSFTALATIMFYGEPSALMLLGAICASAFGMLVAMISGAFKSHPSAAAPVVDLNRLGMIPDAVDKRLLTSPAQMSRWK